MLLFAVSQSGKAVFCFPWAKLVTLVPESPVGEPQVAHCGKQVSGFEEFLVARSCWRVACALWLLQRVPGRAAGSSIGAMGS